MSDVCTIDDLPPELLDKIFISTLEYGGSRTRAPSSSELSHVCRRWRAVALACSHLWSTDLPYCSPDWTQLCLYRCGTVTLDLNIVLDIITRENDGYHAAIGLALARLDRTRSLRIFVRGCALVGSVDMVVDLLMINFQECTVPFLTEVSIEFEDSSTPSILSREVLDAFARYAPIANIQRINMDCCDFGPLRGLPSPLMGPNLRHLSLRDTSIWDNIDTAIASLQAVPLLETLHLSNSHARFKTLSLQSFPPRGVHLPNIKEVFLCGLWAENVALFNYISIPPRTCIILATGHTSDANLVLHGSTVSGHVAVAADAVRQHFSAALRQGAYYEELWITTQQRPKSITITAFPWFEISCPDNNNLSCAMEHPLPSHLELSVPWSDHINAETRQILLNIFSTLPIFTKVQTLNLDQNIWQHYPEIYAAYPCVSSLKIEHGYRARTYLDAYGAQHATLFPALAHICFIDSSFEHEVLMRLVEHLVVAHTALRSVEFCGCDIGEDAAHLMRGRLRERGIDITYSD